MAKTIQSRKFNGVLNNATSMGYTPERLKERLNSLYPTYYCFSYEISSTGTEHAHIFVYRATSAIRNTRMLNVFPGIHLELAYGTCKENRDYIAKEGRYADSEKAKTKIEGSFFEWGKMPDEKEERQSKMDKLLEEIKSGKSTADIIQSYPEQLFNATKIEQARQVILNKKYSEQLRLNIEVCYIFGATGTGKTRSIFEAFEAKDICRITNYSNQNALFDMYTGQDVLVFEEFYSQIPISAMLNYLDIYPTMLPGRYYYRTACYTKIFFTSNIPLDKQYEDIQKRAPDEWKALLRRINKVVEFKSDGTIIERKLNDDE